MNSPSVHVQKVIEYYLVRHFAPGSSLVTAESGNSEYTSIFRELASQHIVYGVTDLAESIDHDPKYDIFYLGGTHRFLELSQSLAFAVSRLKNASILILPHLEIPSTHFCYQYLKEADEFILHHTMEDVAFFGYHGTGPFEPSGWTDSGFNIRNYPAYNHTSYTIYPQLPLQLNFFGYGSQSSEELDRGFIVRSGRVYSEGHYSRLRLTVSPGDSLCVDVELRFRPTIDRGHPNSCVDVRFGYSPLLSYDLAGQDEVVARSQTLLSDDGLLTIDMYHHLPESAEQSGGLSTYQDSYGDLNPSSRLNVELISLSITSHLHSCQPRTISRCHGEVSTFTYDDQTFRFFISDRHDSIQAHHYAGEFYETEELKLIGRYLPPGANILDVGANIGNHMVYFERILMADKVVAIELQPRVIELLKLNAALNGLTKADLSKTGVGLGSRTHHASIHVPQSFNVAGAQFRPDESGHFSIVRGDELLAGYTFDFIKIDIEGMECQAIDGLREIISQSHPLLFVEVWTENSTRYFQQMSQMGYVVVEEYRRYDVATNYLMRHRDAV